MLLLLPFVISCHSSVTNPATLSPLHPSFFRSLIHLLVHVNSLFRSFASICLFAFPVLFIYFARNMPGFHSNSPYATILVLPTHSALFPAETTPESNWSKWSAWGKCMGDGKRSRMRHCRNLEAFLCGDASGNGFEIQKRPC